MTSAKNLTTEEALEILGLDKTADENAVKQAYRRISKSCHPDTSGSNYLFQLVNNAYQTLTDSNTNPNQSTKTAKTSPTARQKKPTRQDLIYSKDFICPFDDFITAAYGIRTHINYKGYTIPIDSDSLRIEYIRTKWPGKVTCRLYANLLQYLLDRPACVADHDIQMVNMYPISTEFQQTLNITVKNPKHKYYRLDVFMRKTGLKIQMKGRVKDATPDDPQEKQETDNRILPMSAKCVLKFTRPSI